MTLYFAYGSNLKLERMAKRVHSARPAGTAWLTGYRIACDKPGADGSGKANLRACAGSRVWGVLYTLDPDHWPALDAFEPGYERWAVEVSCAGRILSAHTYLSRVASADLPPFAWYKRLVVEGAREHGLPDDWLRLLEAWPERGNP